MHEIVTLTAGDGHRLDAYAQVPQVPRGAIVVLQEIFGVTGHIRSIVDRFAAAGYAAVAPALFDRVRRGVELGYTDIEGGRQMVQSLSPADTLLDVEAAVAWARGHGRVGVVGFCWGGTLAFLSAGSLPVDGAVAYYGGMIAQMLDRRPKVPVLYHFGGLDPYITREHVAAVTEAAGQDEVYVYPGSGHGFNCDERPNFNASDAALAWDRTASFLRDVVG